MVIFPIFKCLVHFKNNHAILYTHPNKELYNETIFSSFIFTDIFFLTLYIFRCKLFFDFTINNQWVRFTLIFCKIITILDVYQTFLLTLDIFQTLFKKVNKLDSTTLKQNFQVLMKILLFGNVKIKANSY